MTLWRFLAIAFVALAACSDVQVENPSITVEVEGENPETDARKVVREARKACDNILSPRGVNVTVRFPDGDTYKSLVDCDDGEVHEA